MEFHSFQCSILTQLPTCRNHMSLSPQILNCNICLCKIIFVWVSDNTVDLALFHIKKTYSCSCDLSQYPISELFGLKDKKM